MSYTQSPLLKIVSQYNIVLYTFLIHCPGFPAFAFNVITSQWNELPKLPKDRGYHGVTSLGGQLYITGGYSTINSETLETGTI
jgi:hypothetical protein